LFSCIFIYCYAFVSHLRLLKLTRKFSKRINKRIKCDCMSKIKESMNSFRIIELFIAALLGGVTGRLFAVYWILPGLESQIIGSTIVVFSFLGFAAFFYFIAWLIDSHVVPKLQRSKKQEVTSKKTEEEEIPNSLKLRDEFKNRKI
jgi:hypothetical protein